MSFSNDPFDLDGDGKVDIGESFIEYMTFNEIMKGHEDPDESEDDWESSDSSDNYESCAVSEQTANESKVQKSEVKRRISSLPKVDTGTLDDVSAQMVKFESERNSAKKKSTRKIIIGIAAVVCIIIISIVAFIIINKNREQSRIQGIYEQAEDLVFTGKYDKAIDLLDSIKQEEYKDTDALISFAESHKAYDEGNIYLAYLFLDERSFEYQSEEHMQLIGSFSKEVNSEYKLYKQRQDEELAQALEKRITEGVHFVGMSESRINDTILGEAEFHGHNHFIENGETIVTNLYRWYRNGKWIFGVRCAKGVVISISDFRSDYSGGSSYGNYSGSSSSGKSEEDEFDVGDFSHVDDFYDWYYDDFFDYEEAEDYYYSYGGK